MQQRQRVAERPRRLAGLLPVEALAQQAQAVSEQGGARVDGVEVGGLHGHHPVEQGLHGGVVAVAAGGDLVGQGGGLEHRGQSQGLLLLRIHRVSSMTAPPRQASAS